MIISKQATNTNGGINKTACSRMKANKPQLPKMLGQPLAPFRLLKARRENEREMKVKM